MRQRRVSRAAVVRRSERTRSSSVSDDELGGAKARNAASEASQKPSVGPSKYELQGPTR